MPLAVIFFLYILIAILYDTFTGCKRYNEYSKKQQ